MSRKDGDRIAERIASAQLAYGLVELAGGRTAADWVCREVLGVLPGDTFSEQRRKYRTLARMCCLRSGRYDRLKYRQLRTAWKILRGRRR